MNSIKEIIKTNKNLNDLIENVIKFSGAKNEFARYPKNQKNILLFV